MAWQAALITTKLSICSSHPMMVSSREPRVIPIGDVLLCFARFLFLFWAGFCCPCAVYTKCVNSLRRSFGTVTWRTSTNKHTSSQHGSVRIDQVEDNSWISIEMCKSMQMDGERAFCVLSATWNNHINHIGRWNCRS